MAKCYSCGKKFDYEKYYGICPKCGAYNKKTTSEEQHRELHEQYDQAELNQLHYEDTTAGYRTSEYDTSYYREQSGQPNGKKSYVGIVVCILLTCGIIGAIVPFIYAAFKAEREISDVIDWAEDFEIDDDYYFEDEIVDEIDEPDYEEFEVVPQLIRRSLGEDIILGGHKSTVVCVEGARVIVGANQVEGFPANEKLVAISLSHSTTNEDYFNTECMYVGYGDGELNPILDAYYFEDYGDVLEGVHLLESYDFFSPSVSGEVLLFVPEEIMELELYLISVDIDNDCIIETDYVPIVLQE